jgi:hypothetical protein
VVFRGQGYPTVLFCFVLDAVTLMRSLCKWISGWCLCLACTRPWIPSPAPRQK